MLYLNETMLTSHHVRFHFTDEFPNSVLKYSIVLCKPSSSDIFKKKDKKSVILITWAYSPYTAILFCSYVIGEESRSGNCNTIIIKKNGLNFQDFLYQ